MSSFKYVYKAGEGLDEKVVRDISKRKKEPEWMRKKRLQALEIFRGLSMPRWGADLTGIDFDKLHYYLKPFEKQKKSWEDVPREVRETFEKIGVPQTERGLLSGVKSQLDSEVIYGSLKRVLAKKGVVFLSMDDGLRRYPKLIKKYWGSVVPVGDNKLAALNSAVWSGGSFIYVPQKVDVGLPLQAYFRINTERAGQFERTLIIAEEGSKLHYVEGCSAPRYSSASLHAAVVEIIVKKGARVTYTTIQNWYNNVYNLVTKRALVAEKGQMRWIDCNLGCLVADSLVSTPGGWKRIEEIKEGENVYAMDLEEMKPVKALVKGQKMMGVKKVFELSTWDHRKIRATNNHPFLSLKRRHNSKVYEMSWSALKDLKEGDLVGVLSCLGREGVFKDLKVSLKSNRLVNIPDLPAKSNEDVMWFLGAYLGDGCLERVKTQEGIRGRRVNLAIPKDDKAHKRAVNVLKKWKLKWQQKGVTKRIGSTYLAEMIRQLGFEGTAKTKMVPNWVYLLPLNQRLAFIEGYLDTDGYVRKKKVVDSKPYGQLVFASANKRLLEQMKLLMITCGLEPRKITTYIKERKLYKDIQKEYVSHYMSMNIHDNLTVIRKKKYEGKYFRFVRVRGIEKMAKKQKVYDIEVKGHHNFIANGMIVHNSKTTMKYPACILAGRKAKGEMLSIAWAGENQHIDAGAKMIHLGRDSSSRIVSKSVSKDGGRSSYRGLVQIVKGAVGARSKVNCDALILDDKSRSDTYPKIKIFEKEASLEHEATVGKIEEEKLFYLMSRGLSKEQAETVIVNGFLEPVMKKIPLEYAVEMNRLVDMNMEGSVG